MNVKQKKAGKRRPAFKFFLKTVFTEVHTVALNVKVTELSCSEP